MKEKVILVTAAAALALSASGCGESGNGLMSLFQMGFSGKEESFAEEELSISEDMLAGELVLDEEVKTQAPMAEERPEEVSPQEDPALPETQAQQETEPETETETGTETETETQGGEELNEIQKLTQEEIQARREKQAEIALTREAFYKLENSIDKTKSINQLDRQILANNTFDFSGKNIVFIGDSITEGVTASVGISGNKISYATYAESYLHFNKLLNHGSGGRMFSTYGGSELSLIENFENVTNIDSDIIVVFAGVNDYLSTPDGKRFGDVDDKMSTAGYCGAVRSFMKQLDNYYGDRDIFFVTMYNISRKSVSNYSDIATQPTLGDYMEVQRKLAREYGFHIIELYDTGFMSCADGTSAEFYLRDALHPKDNGNIALGEHIAAELSLYFGQKESSE